MFGSITYVGPSLFPVPYLDFIPGLAPPPWKEGRVFYDDINKTLAVYNSESDVTLQLGQELYILVKNETGDMVPNGTLVFINGASGIRPTIDLAKSDTSATTRVVAMVTHDIGIGEEGFCTTFGSVGGLNTLLWPAGTSLYLSDSEAGEWTSTAPTAPSFPIAIGVVTYQNETEGRIQTAMGPTDVAESMVIQDLEINNDLRVAERFTLKPSPVTDITAVGGITVTNATMRIQGDGGPVEITANPQITPSGTDGQVVFLHGSDDTNTVTIHDGDGLHLHSGSKLIMGEHDHIMLQYDTSGGLWEEVSTNFKSFDTGWAFSSPAGDYGTYYVAGFYVFGSTSFTPAGGTTLGSANVAYAAHAFLVLGATSTDMVVRVTGTSITEAGVNTPGDFEDIDTSGGVLNDYFETPKKWIGQVSYSLQSGTGVAINNGLCKYWDNQNSDFRITGIEVTGQAGSNDTAPNFLIYRHTPLDWTFNAGNEATPPTPVADMQTDYGTEYQFSNGQPFAWKRVGLSEEIAGGSDEGIICQIVTTSNKAVEILNWTLSIRPS
jgi:hypothetical protein